MLPGDADVPDPSRALPFECPLVAVVVVVTSALRECKYFFFAADAISADAAAVELGFSPRGVEWADEGSEGLFGVAGGASEEAGLLAVAATPFITSAILTAAASSERGSEKTASEIPSRTSLPRSPSLPRDTTRPRGAGKIPGILPPFPLGASDPFEESGLVLKATRALADKQRAA